MYFVTYKLVDLIMNVSTMNFVFRLKIVRFFIILPLSVFVGFELARACAVYACLSLFKRTELRLAWHYLTLWSFLSFFAQKLGLQY